MEVWQGQGPPVHSIMIKFAHLGSEKMRFHVQIVFLGLCREVRYWLILWPCCAVAYVTLDRLLKLSDDFFIWIIRIICTLLSR